MRTRDSHFRLRVELIKTKRGEADNLRVCDHTYVVMDGDATLLPR